VTYRSSKSDLRFAVVGVGVQGTKRRAVIADASCVTADSARDDADYHDIRSVPLEDFDVAFLCTPDSFKFDIVSYLVAHGKHVLVEKPLSLTPDQYDEIERIQVVTGSTIYVAYNHRFEPHVATAKSVLDSGEIGEIYTVSLSYGNGTAELVRQSEWRDSGLGVIPDLGSHLLDMVDFWWGLEGRSVDFVEARSLENRSCDHAVFRITGDPVVWAETTMLSWRNDFRCDIRASEGSLHISSLCKWGPSSLTVRGRVHPSGRPEERMTTLVKADPTWAAEHEHFLGLITAGEPGNLKSSREISRILGEIEQSLGQPL